jgi:hypothetical protein
MSKPAKEILEELPGGGFDIDSRGIRMTFLKKQQRIHPDSFSGAGEVSRTTFLPLETVAQCFRLVSSAEGARPRHRSVFTFQQGVHNTAKSLEQSKVPGEHIPT